MTATNIIGIVLMIASLAGYAWLIWRIARQDELRAKKEYKTLYRRLHGLEYRREARQ